MQNLKFIGMLILTILVLTLAGGKPSQANTIKHKPIHKHQHHKTKHKIHRKYTPANRVSDVIALQQTHHKYDKFFTAADSKALPWKTLKVLCSTESNLKANLVSNQGAMGICQLKPRTFRRVMKSGNIGKPDLNILAASRHIKILDNSWKRAFTDPGQRQLITIASYNAGEGNVLKAIKRCHGDNHASIKRCLPKETQAFVNTIVLASI